MGPRIGLDRPSLQPGQTPVGRLRRLYSLRCRSVNQTGFEEDKVPCNGSVNTPMGNKPGCLLQGVCIHSYSYMAPVQKAFLTTKKHQKIRKF